MTNLSQDQLTQERIRERLRKRMEEIAKDKKDRIIPTPPPRYDEVFEEGLDELDKNG